VLEQLVDKLSELTKIMYNAGYDDAKKGEPRDHAGLAFLTNRIQKELARGESNALEE